MWRNSRSWTLANSMTWSVSAQSRSATNPAAQSSVTRSSGVYERLSRVASATSLRLSGLGLEPDQAGDPVGVRFEPVGAGLVDLEDDVFLAQVADLEPVDRRPDPLDPGRDERRGPRVFSAAGSASSPASREQLVAGRAAPGTAGPARSPRSRRARARRAAAAASRRRRASVSPRRRCGTRSGAGGSGSTRASASAAEASRLALKSGRAVPGRSRSRCRRHSRGGSRRRAVP